MYEIKKIHRDTDVLNGDVRSYTTTKKQPPSHTNMTGTNVHDIKEANLSVHTKQHPVHPQTGDQKAMADMVQEVGNLAATFTEATKQSEAVQANLAEKSQAAAISEVKAANQKALTDMAEEIRNLVAAFTEATEQSDADQANQGKKIQAAISEVKSDVQESICTLANEVAKLATLKAPDEQTASKKVDIAPEHFAWQDFSLLITSPSAFFLSVAVLAITGLLVFFQTSAYITGGLGSASLPIAAVCELSLVALTIFFSAKMQKKTAAFLFLAVFGYVLATMSYDLASTSIQEVTTATTNNKQTASIETQIETYIEAFQTATKKQENGNMAKWSSKIDDAKKELTNLQTTAKSSDTARLIEAKCSGMIVLRALLMLLNAFFVHALIGIFKRNNEQVIAI